MRGILDFLLIISFLATMYSTVCVFIPLKPFRNRYHAMKGLLLTFFVMTLLAAVDMTFMEPRVNEQSRATDGAIDFR